jgi:1,4-alpha-glucan branching enzyme
MARKTDIKKTPKKAAIKESAKKSSITVKATTKAGSKSKAIAKKQAVSKSKSDVIEPIKKQYLKSRHVCKVTFRLPKLAAPEASDVRLVGDFNEWDTVSATALKRLSSGEFAVTVELEPGREYGFRYLIDGQKWENHWNADKYRSNARGSDNSIVIT